MLYVVKFCRTTCMGSSCTRAGCFAQVAIQSRPPTIVKCAGPMDVLVIDAIHSATLRVVSQPDGNIILGP